MLTLDQAQSIYDKGMQAYSQAYNNTRTYAFTQALNAIYEATTVIHPEDKMPLKMKSVFLKAVTKAHYQAQSSTVALDREIPLCFKKELEDALSIENIQTNKKQSFIYGKGYFRIGLYEQAIKTLESAIIEAPSCTMEANYYLGKSHACLKNYEVSKDYFLALIKEETNPDLLADYYDYVGLLYFVQGMYDEAIHYFELALQNNKENLSALHNKTLTHLVKDIEPSFEYDYSTCQTLLYTILAYKPSHPRALQAQGDLYDLCGLDEKAIKCYLAAREHCPVEDKETLFAIKEKLAESYAQAGHQLYQASNYQIAQDFYKKAISEDSQHHVAISQLGMCLYNIEDFNGALTYFNELINFPIPDNPSQDDLDKNREIHSDAWLNRAAALRKIGATQLSKGAWAMSYDLSPTDPALHKERNELSATIIQKKYQFFKQIKTLQEQDITSLTINCSASNH